MTNPTAPYEAETIAPLIQYLDRCPVPNRYDSDGEPIFISLDAMKSHVNDVYYLTLHTPSDEQPENGECTWYDEWRITLVIPRKTAPAKARIEAWLESNLPSWLLYEWQMQDVDRPGRFRGLIGVMTMEAA